MNGKRVFVDTNIVVYSYSASDPIKQHSAASGIIDNECVISTQVLNEYANVCIKKLGVPVETGVWKPMLGSILKGGIDPFQTFVFGVGIAMIAFAVGIWFISITFP